VIGDDFAGSSGKRASDGATPLCGSAEEDDVGPAHDASMKAEASNASGRYRIEASFLYGAAMV
jgi:hypothetical protein